MRRFRRSIAKFSPKAKRHVAQKQFREDLFYRLSMVEIHVPSLEERKEDLPLLTAHFIEKFATQYQKPIRSMTQRARIMLARHSWPGNIRELENVIGHACMMVLGDTIDARDLPDYLRAPNRNEPIQTPAANESGSGSRD